MLLGTRGQRGQTPALGHTARPTLPCLHSVSSQPQMPLGGDLLFLTWSVDTPPFYSPGRSPGFPISKGSFFLKKWSSSWEKEWPDLSEGPSPISYFSPRLLGFPQTPQRLLYTFASLVVLRGPFCQSGPSRPLKASRGFAGFAYLSTVLSIAAGHLPSYLISIPWVI